MRKFLTDPVSIYFASGGIIKGIITFYSEEYLELTELNGNEAMIFKPADNIILIRKLQLPEIDLGDLNLEVPDPELPSPNIDLSHPDIPQQLAMSRVEQIKNHQKAVGAFISRSQQKAPQVPFVFPSFQK